MTRLGELVTTKTPPPRPTGGRFITSEGCELILEVARQVVPDGYGNPYFVPGA